MSVNQGPGSLSRDDRSSSSLGGGVPRSLCATSSASLMMGVEAADGVRVQAAQRCRIELQRALGLLGRSFEKRFDQRDEMSAEVLENHDATGNIAGQQRRAMTATGSACGKEGAGDPLLRQARGLEHVLVHGIVLGERVASQ
jgi:hypothetical protein